VIDAALIAAAQRVEHYEIAAYGCLRTYAQLLGHESAAKLLTQTLSEEEAADKKLTAIGGRRPCRWRVGLPHSVTFPVDSAGHLCRCAAGGSGMSGCAW
jgi:hypothetical protein